MGKNLSFVGLMVLMVVLGACSTISTSGQMTDKEARGISIYLKEHNRGK